MLCDWTEKVSLLVDGELARAEAASVETHLAGCAECRAARDEFMFFRRQLVSYRAGVNPSAQARALEAILGSKPDGATATRAARRGGLLAALGLSPLRPATAGALALAMLVAVGLAAYLSRRPDVGQLVQAPPAGPADAPSVTTTPQMPQPTPEVREGVREPQKANVAHHSPRGKGRDVSAKANSTKSTPFVRREASRAVAGATRPRPDARGPAPTREANLHTAAAHTAAAAGAERRELPRAGLDTSRHVEQAQLLLRSFRNARADDDLAYERERSERLLYRNIVLRREAARQNDPLLASVLGRLEPILLDIANLPARPAAEDVASIRERLRKQNLVVVLQAGVAKN